MCKTRRGVVVLIQAGDPEICEPIKSGMLAGREKARGDRGPLPALRATVPRAYRPHLAENSTLCCFPGARCPNGGRLLENAATGGRLLEDQRRVVSAEMDRQAIREGLREAVGNTKTPADYAAMRCRAEIEWGEPVDFPSPLRKLGDGLLAAYAMVICGLSAAFHAQDHILGG